MKQSVGKCVIVPATGELCMPFMAAREAPRVVDGKLAQGTGQVMEGLFKEAVASCVNGEKALEGFSSQASCQLGI